MFPTKICPDCGDDIPARVKSHRCGWREYTPASKTKVDDPKRLQCANVERGLRCAEIGTLTENLRGGDGREPHPGPWYCYRHFPPFSGREYGAPKTAPPTGFQGLRQIIAKRIRPLREPGEDDV